LLAVVADDEWSAVRASRALRAQWSEGTGLPSQAGLVESLRNEPGIVDETLVNKGSPAAQRPDGAKALNATYYWPMQSHASIGPSCAVADVSSDSRQFGLPSQGTHGNRKPLPNSLGLPLTKCA
jgi:hypothetical protein